MIELTKRHVYLKQIRDAFGMTQNRFARLLGVSRSALQNWENARSLIPDPVWISAVSIYNLTQSVQARTPEEAFASALDALRVDDKRPNQSRQ